MNPHTNCAVCGGSFKVDYLNMTVKHKARKG